MKKIIKKLFRKISLIIAPQLYLNFMFSNVNQSDWKNIFNENTENEMGLLKYFLTNKNDVFFDVGANLGKYVFLSAKLVNHNNIHAFEPHPGLFNDLKQLFKGVKFHNLALSNQIGTIEFKIPIFEGKEIHTRGKLDVDFVENNETDANILKVEVDKLDNFTEKLNNVKLIKIDVEGAEFDVLSGAIETINKFRPYLIVEIEQRHSKDNILTKIQTNCDMFQYSSYILNTKTFQLSLANEIVDIIEIQDSENHAKNKHYINNFIFIPNELMNSGIIEKINSDITKSLSF